MNKIILRLEGLFLFIVSLYFYQLLSGSWVLFLVLVLTPDISMVGYFVDKKLGATIYNLVHNYILALLLVALGMFIIKNNTIVLLGVILFSHVAMDRAMGFGLKYKTDFKDTHLQKV